MQRSPFGSHSSLGSSRTHGLPSSTWFLLREALTVFFYVLFYLIILAIFTAVAYAGQSYPCTLNAVDRTVTVCTPASSAVLDSPIRIVAGTLHSQPVTLMQIYVDGAKVFEASGDMVDTNLNLAPGTHRITAQALDAKGFYNNSVQVTIKNAFVPRFAYSAATDGTVSAYALHPFTGQPRANGYAVGHSSSTDAVVSWGRFLYVANGTAGTISAFIVSSSGRLTQISGSPFRCGTDCRGIAIHPSGNYLFVTDFAADVIHSYRVDGNTGALWDHGSSQTGGQPHSVAVDPGGRFLYVTNYADSSVSAFSIMQDGHLVALTPFQAGANPTRLAIDRTARFVAIANSGSNSVSVYFLTSTGALRKAAGSPAAVPSAPGAIAMYPTGAFVYVLHPSANRLSAYKVGFSTGALTWAGTYGTAATPRSATIDPQGKFLYVVNSSSPTEMWAFRINQTTGALSLAYKSRTRGAAAALVLSQGSSAVTHTPRFLHAGSTNDATLSGSVAAFIINPNGTLTRIAGSPFAHPTGVTALAAHPTGKFLYAPGRQRISWGGIAVEYLINAATGALTVGQVLDEVEPLYAHAMAVDPSGRFAYAPSSPDGEPALFGWSINQTSGALGSWLFYALGPRNEHLSLDPTGKFAYFVEAPETNVKTIDPRDGHWTAEYAMTLRPFIATVVDPSGQFVIAIDPTNNIVASHRVNGTTGKLTEVWATSTGIQPYAVAVDPYGRFVFVVNNGSGSVNVYRLNGSTGSLSQIAESPFATGLYPVRVAVDESGRYLYVANSGTRNISAYSINGSTGALTELPGSPFATGVAGPLTSISAVGVTK